MFQTVLRPQRRSYASTIYPTAGAAALWLLTMIVVCGFLNSPSYAQESVLTQNANNTRDAVYSNAGTLTPTSNIHKLFTLTLDAPVKGQALIVSGVPGGPKNLLVVATSSNHATSSMSAYGFDADIGGAPIWHTALGTSAPFSTAAPVVDPSVGPHGAVFVATKDSGGSNKLHALDLLNGAELAGSPVTIGASAGGATFNSGQHNPRTGLTEVNGTIYVAYCHMTDSGAYHGWLIGYKYTGSGFAQNGVWCDTCAGGNAGGIWGGGDGNIFDGTSIFAETGNGSMGGGNFGMSVVKLNPSNIGTVEASFVPAGAAAHSASDQDLNGGGMVLMPGTGGKIFLGPTKYGSLYLIDSTNLGRGALGTFGAGNAVGHSPVAFDSGTAQYAYVWGSGNPVEQFCYNPAAGNVGGGACHTSSFSGGGTLAISADPNNGGNAILWAFGGGVLHAMNPANVSAPDFWNSNLHAGDSIGSPGGFQFLAIANGKVYAPTGSTIVVYGSTIVTCSPPTAPSGLSATSSPTSTTVDLTWNASTSNCSITYNVFRSTTSGFTPSSGNQIGTASGTSFADTTGLPNTQYFYLVEATNVGGTSGQSNQAMATTGNPPPPSSEINAGGPAVSPFTADADFAGGKTINHANTIDLTHVTMPAPMAVYQTARIGTFTYTIPGFTAGSSHQVRLHFAETFWTAAGKRTFNVAINGTQVLTAFDIFKAAGAQNRANIQEFSATASSSGSIVITFTTVIDNSLISGIEIH
jgi:hypothetical protein